MVLTEKGSSDSGYRIQLPGAPVWQHMRCCICSEAEVYVKAVRIISGYKAMWQNSDCQIFFEVEVKRPYSFLFCCSEIFGSSFFLSQFIKLCFRRIYHPFYSPRKTRIGRVFPLACDIVKNKRYR